MRRGGWITFGGGLLAGWPCAPLWWLAPGAGTDAAARTATSAGDCATCHTADGWTPLRKPLPFDHRAPASRWWPRTPRPAAATATRAWSSRRWAPPAPTATATRTAARSGPECDACHMPESWTNRREVFRVHTRTRFPLLAAHAAARLRGLPPRPAAARVRGHSPTECAALPSWPDYRPRRAIPTTSGSASRGACGSPSRGAEGDVRRARRAPRARPHAQVPPLPQRLRGHAAPVRGLPPRRLRSHARTRPPRRRVLDHVRGLPQRRRWPPATFDHELSRFPLTGAHARRRVHAVPRGRTLRGHADDCVSCHQDDYDRARTRTTARRVPDHLPELPRHEPLAAGDVRP